MNFSPKQKAWIKLICLVLSSGGGVTVAAHAGGATIGWAILAGLITAGSNVYHALGDSPADAGGPPALQSGGIAPAIIIALCLLGAPASSTAADFTNTFTLRALVASTNIAAIPFVKYDLSSKQFGYGAAGLYKVSDNFWTGLRIDRINGFQTTAGVQAQLQQTFQINSFTFTPFIEASVGLGDSSLYGSAGPGAFIHLFHKDFRIQGHPSRLNFELVGDFEHVVYNGKKSNQVNGGPILNFTF